MSALIGALRASLSLETAQFEAGAKRAQRVNNNLHSSFKRTFGGLGGLAKAGLAGLVSGLSVGLLIQGAKAALEYAGSLAEVAQQLGVTTRDLQVFRYAAGQVGVSQKELETGLSKLTITLGKVAAGSKAPAAALNAIGISVDQLKGKDTGEAFRIIADGLEKVTDRSQRAAVEVALFGRSGAMLDNLLAGGSDAINGLAIAADKLGIVLSDEQIQKADETADKLEAVKTVLAAQIAGVVADNAQAIIGLADSLAYLVSQAAQAAQKMTAFYRSIAISSARFVSGLPPAAQKLLFGTKGSAAILRAGAGAIRGNIADAAPPKITPRATGGADIGKFLAGGGGGGRGKAKRDTSERDRLDALRDANQFDQELLRGQMDILRARQDLAVSADARADLERQMLDLEQQALQSQLQYEVAAGEKTQTQADQILAQQQVVDGLRREAIDQEKRSQVAHDAAELKQTEYDIQIDTLELESSLALTAKQKRDVELRILDAMEAQEKARLEAVLADQQSSALAKQEAQKRLNALNSNYGAKREQVLRDTAGPLESAKLQFGDITDEMEQLKVDGIMGAVDALTQLTDGFGSFKDAALSAIKQVIAEFIRLQLLKAAFSLFGGGMGGGAGVGASVGGGFAAGGNISMPTLALARGGGFTVTGNAGIDRNVMSINGLPIARVSHGERVSVSNDNARGGGATTVNFAITGPVSRETMGQIAAKTKLAIATANRKGM